MVNGVVLVAAVLAGIVLIGWGLAAKSRSAESRRGRRWWRTVLIGFIALIAALFALVIIEVVEPKNRYAVPWPEFPELAVNPDSSLQGTIAFISGPGSPVIVGSGPEAKPEKRSCARIVSASGGTPRDAVCWPMTEREIASVVWREDGRLRVTVFDPPVGKEQPTPVWGRIYNPVDGLLEPVADDELSADAFPAPAPLESADGQTLSISGRDGTVKIEVSSSGGTGTRTVFDLRDTNPGFGIYSGPEWSDDSKWFVFFDGQRLLTTTVAEPALTRVLVDDVSGSIADFGAQSFAMTAREF